MADPWSNQNDYIDFMENRGDFFFDSANRMSQGPSGFNPRAFDPVIEPVDTPTLRRMQNYAMSAPNTLEGMIAAELLVGGTPMSVYSKIQQLASGTDENAAMIRSMIPKTYDSALGQYTDTPDMKYVMDTASKLEDGLVTELSALEGDPNVRGSIEEGGFYVEKPSELAQKYMDAGLYSPMDVFSPEMASPTGMSLGQARQAMPQGSTLDPQIEALQRQLEAEGKAGMYASLEGVPARDAAWEAARSGQQAAPPPQGRNTPIADFEDRAGNAIQNWLSENIGNPLDWRGSSEGMSLRDVGDWLTGGGGEDAGMQRALDALNDTAPAQRAGGWEPGGQSQSAQELERLRKAREAERESLAATLRQTYGAGSTADPRSGMQMGAGDYLGSLGAVMGMIDRGETPLGNQLMAMGRGMIDTGVQPTYDPRTGGQFLMTDRENNPNFAQNARDALRRGSGWYTG